MKIDLSTLRQISLPMAEKAMTYGSAIALATLLFAGKIFPDFNDHPVQDRMKSSLFLGVNVALATVTKELLENHYGTPLSCVAGLISGVAGLILTDKLNKLFTNYKNDTCESTTTNTVMNGCETLFVYGGSAIVCGTLLRNVVKIISTK